MTKIFRPTIATTSARLLRAAPRAQATRLPTRFEMKVYGGSPFWVEELGTDVVFDLDTLRGKQALVSFGTEFDPDSSMILGQARTVTNGRSLFLDGRITACSTPAFNLAAAAKREHWRASLRIDERKLVGWVGVGESTWINGRVQSGPFAIFTGYLRGISVNPDQGDAETRIKFMK